MTNKCNGVKIIELQKLIQKDMWVKKDDYPVCFSTDEQTQSQYEN